MNQWTVLISAVILCAFSTIGCSGDGNPLVPGADPDTFIDVPSIPSGYHYTQVFPLVTSDDVFHIFYIYWQSASAYGDLYEITRE